MQNYKEINGNDYVKDSRTTINETMRSIQSMNSGTVFPTTNLFEGMKCYRTDLKKTYTLTDVENNTWVEDDIASKLSTARKINITGNATGAANFDGSGNISINTTVNNSAAVGNHAESDFLRYRGATTTNGENTLWDQIGIKEYNNVLPESLNGTYTYGAVISFPSANNRLDIWYDCYASNTGTGLYYRTGWQNDKRAWARLLDSSNYNNYAPTKTGSGASGTWPISISGNATNADKLDGYHASDIISKIYPVGSIYMSMSATNPATLFGVGTWTRISQGRMLLGADDSGYKAGATGGEATHQLTVNEMPAHSHSGTTSWNGKHTHGVRDADYHDGYGNSFDSGDWGPQRYIQTTEAGDHNHTFTTDNAGGGAAHNNMPPYLVCYIWQRTA